jgi:hypothetical protein
MKYLLCFLITYSIIFSETNPWSLPIFERIVNRKQISHIIFENRATEYRISFLVCDRFPYNYKSKSYAFFIKFNSADERQKRADEFDKHLEEGKEVKFYLNGSEIKKYEFLN